MYYNVIAVYNICGKECECLATHDNGQAIFLDKASAEKRLEEVQKQGYKAHIEEQKKGTAWWDDENWIG